MEQLPQQQSQLDMAGNSKSCPFFEDPDVLMKDPFLDYVNEILMEEHMDEGACMEQVDHVSYQAIFNGFSDILGDRLSPNSYVDSSLCNILSEHVSPKCVDDVLHHEMGSDDEQHVKVVNPNDGMCNMPNEPIDRHGKVVFIKPSFQHQRAEDGFTPEHDFGFPDLASHTRVSNLSSKLTADTMGRISHVVEGGLEQGQISHVVEGQRCRGGLGEQGHGDFKGLSADEEFSSKLAEIDLSFQDRKLKAVYTDLYFGEEPGTSAGAARHKKEYLAIGAVGDLSKSGKKSTPEVEMFTDVMENLVRCAQAVAIGDARTANQIWQELYQVQGASANGTALQRTAHFFSEALAARLRGMGQQHFQAISRNMPSMATFLMASKLGFVVTPLPKMMNYFANQSILKAAEGASRLHVVDFGLLNGTQWPSLIHAMADRKGGPPLLVVTAIESSQPGINLAERLEESGRRLAAYAKTYGVPFQYHAIVTNKWEDLDAASLHIKEGEILVVNCIKCLRNLADESVDLALTMSRRQKFLTRMHSLKPHLLVTAVMNAACNSPFFVTRFREALYYHANIFDMLDTMWGNTSERLIMERSCYYRNIVNIVACEGAERVERPETYKQWHARITKAGFKQLPIPATILSRARSHVKQHHHRDFFVDDDANGWMLLGWKGRTTVAISAWQTSLV